MPHRMIEKPPHRDRYLEEVLGRVDALGVKSDAVEELRAAVDSLETFDPATAGLIVNDKPGRDRIRAGLLDGSLTVVQARKKLVDHTARVAADVELAKVLAEAAGSRVGAAWAMAFKIEWHDVIGPVGQAAADKVAELASTLPAGTTDASALTASDDVRKQWLEFGRTITRWGAAVSLLDDLRWVGLESHEPLTVHAMAAVPTSEWRWSTDALMSTVATEHKGYASYGREDLLDYLKATDMVPGTPTPTDVRERFEARERVIDQSPALVRLGWRVPGGSAPRDLELPRQIAELVGRTG